MAVRAIESRQESAPPLVAPSILSAEFARLGDEVRRLQEAGADWVHVDVMDGHFVPNLTIGPCVIDSLRRATDLPLDVHLMIEKPERLMDDFLKAGADLVTFHLEAVAPERCRTWTGRGWRLNPDPPARRETALRARELVDRVRERKRKVGLVLNPETGADWIDDSLLDVDQVLVMSVWPGFGGQSFLPDALGKIGELRRRLPAQVHLEVDGGITLENVQTVRQAGANVIVAGTAVFKAPALPAAIAALRR